jgi:hypothetical protein
VATISASGATSPLIEYSPRRRRGTPAVGLSGQFASQIGWRVVAERKHLRTAQLAPS